MKSQEILNNFGQFSALYAALFETHTIRNPVDKNHVLLSAGEVCKSVYYVLSGSFYQFHSNEMGEAIIDLHLQGEWIFNQQSLTGQMPSDTTIKAFSKSEVIELNLSSFHAMNLKSPSFLQFASIFTQASARTSIFDHSLNPAQKYAFINKIKPQFIQVFPLKMIASYLKVTPETLSRVIANYSIS